MIMLKKKLCTPTMKRNYFYRLENILNIMKKKKKMAKDENDNFKVKSNNEESRGTKRRITFIKNIKL